ncbi:DUF3313 domain-containing protein [Caulobacter sp. NIBR2454]|uniref:DUF3313 domain-containing protein n=1 Tax=Caulobacter sp. NIBR2454 TaxID=3015996 RepID=UPI0022B616FA|nr:DUF3313 domain-containing protein [Caulobacter sp. NIBR2454]
MSASLKTARLALGTALLMSVAACATAPLKPGGNLASYDGMAEAEGPRTKARIRYDREALGRASTAKIIPARLSAEVEAVGLTPEQKDLVVSALNRSLCDRIAERYDIVPETSPADLTVSSTITHVEKTEGGVAGVSRVASALSPIPFTPRLPIGMGSLAGEAEVKDASGRQVASMIWARGADAFTTNARFSEIGDAYELSEAFGRDMGRMVTRRADPFESAPKRDYDKRDGDDPQCAVFGKKTGVAGFIGERLGAPPSWTDKGAAEPETPKATPRNEGS